MRGSVKSDRLRCPPAAEHPLINGPHLFADSWPGKILADEIASTSAHCYSIIITHFAQYFQTGGNFLGSRSNSQRRIGLETFRQITLGGHEYWLRMRPPFKHRHGKPFTQ